jgi:hypothetical protein
LKLRRKNASQLSLAKASEWPLVPRINLRHAPAIRRRSRENSMTGCAQSIAESPERDLQSADGIFPILAYGPRAFTQPSSAANRGRLRTAGSMSRTAA